jgi:UDP-glucose 4-epimerase
VKTLVIGGGGLIGSSLRKAFFREFGYYQQPHAVPWENIEDAVSVLRRNVKDFLAECGMEAWVIAWCAGRGGFSSTTAELASEHVYLNCVLDELTQSRNNNGVFFFASSAGAIYTESGSQVFTEKSPTSVSNDYGIHKLEQEGVVSQFAQRTKTKCVIGRLVSIYGPNQNLEKPQGLISRLCLNSKMNVSTDIYVSLGTTRNYLFADDAANMIQQYISYVYNLVIEYDCYSTVKIFCSHESVSISTVCKALSNVTKKKTLIKAHLSAGLPKYPEHFNIASTTNPDLGKFCQTTLVSGIGQVFKKIQL